MRDLRRKLLSLGNHFFERLKTANFSTACGTSTLKSLPSRAFFVSDVHLRPRKHFSRCTLDCGFKTSESPALRGFVGGPRALATAALYLVLKSNGLRHSKNLPVKFVFFAQNRSCKYRQKVTATTLFPTVSHPDFQLLSQTAHVCFRRRKRVHNSAFGERSHTTAHTAKQGPSLPRPQCGFVPPAKYLIFRHAFIYIHFPVLCEPSTPAEEENLAKLLP